ncbi:MAG TPA: NAD-dependent succinate-semialdehyde dehydrogenase [Gemmatimonadales bacterium]
MTIATVNPATGQTLRTFSPLSDSELDARLQCAADTFGRYRRMPLADRLSRLQRAAEILDTEKEELGRLMVTEMGKTLKAAVEEAAKCAWGCRYYVEHAERFLADEPVATGATRSFIAYQPIGPILAVMPWNFPFWQVFRFAAPALAAGNVGLLKHASNVPQCALAIQDIFRRAGFPEGCFQTLLIETERVRRVIDDPRVVAVTLTGSTGAGSAVASESGKQIKKSVLELGGSDPFIVMPSCDLETAARTAVRARTINNGQSCIAAKRFIAVGSIAEEFERRLVEGTRSLVVGDPMDPATDVGPLANEAQVTALADQVQRSVRAGARLLTGGHPLDRPGFYFAPGVLTDITPESPAYREEVFGPVALLFRARDIDQAIAMANDSPFGLGASAWTGDEREQDRFIRDLEAGMVFINGMVASDPRLPFGGVKQSGYGRELSVYGLREFVNIKTVSIQQEAPRQLSESE